MWNGVFSPTVVKHRDYRHSSFAEHEFANGAFYRIGQKVLVDRNPIDNSLFDPPRDYYLVEITLHSNDMYIYLIPAEPDGSRPNNKRVVDTMNAYAENRVEGGRNVLDYLHEDVLEDFLLDRRQLVV